MESRIKQLREKRGLIQEILAVELGITQQMLSKYERDVTLIKVDILKKIAAYFNVTTDYLLGVSDVKRDLNGQMKMNEVLDKRMQNELYIVADAIKALREARGLTQEQLAEKADISVSHLAKIETHARLMGMKTYIRLLEAMDIPIKEHFIHMGTAKKDMMLKEKIWYLVQDCDERETSLLIYSIEGIKKGLKEYQQDSRK